MIIPDPVALPEESVRVLNYRMRPAVWEEGELRHLRYTPTHEITRYDGSKFEITGYWTYEVYVDRPTRNPHKGMGGYVLTVGEDKIKASSAREDGKHAEG